MFTSELTTIPSFHEFLSVYDFGIAGVCPEVYNVASPQEIDDILGYGDYSYTIDYTENVALSGYLIQKARDNQQLNFVFGRSTRTSLSTSGYTFHGSLRLDYIVQIVCDVLVPTWDPADMALLISTNESRQLLAGGVNFWEEKFQKVVYLSNNYENIKRQIGIELKSEGIRKAFVLTQDPYINNLVINALEEKFMAGSGFSYGILSETLHVLLNQAEPVNNELLRNGLAFVVEQGVESATSIPDVMALKIQKLMNMLESAQDQATVLSKDVLFDCCYEQNHAIKGNLSYINSQNGEIVSLGYFNHDEFVTEGDQVYPGGETTFDSDGKISVEFSYYDGLVDTYLDFDNTVQLAIQEVQQQGFFPETWQLAPHEFFSNYTETIPDELVQKMFAPDNLKGTNICIFAVWLDPLVQQIYDYETNNIGSYSVHMFPFSRDIQYTNPLLYPYFHPSAYPVYYIYFSYISMFEFLDWKIISALYDLSNVGSVSNYQAAASLSPNTGVELIGTAEQNGFNSDWTWEEFLDSMSSWLDEIIERRIRIVNFLASFNNPNTWILEYFYDQGLRKGDVIITQFDLPDTLLAFSSLASNEPLYELLEYSLNVINPLADSLEPFYDFQLNYYKLYGNLPSSLACWMYDGIFHLAHGLQSTISKGQDYEVPSILNLHLKRIQFTGWNGNISFDQQTNVRKRNGFGILQFRYNKETQEFDSKLVGKYTALSSPFFSLPDVEWHDNEVPSQIRPLYKNWPFEKYQISDSEFGDEITYGIGVIIIIYAGVCTFFLYSKTKHLKVVPIENTLLSGGDIIFWMLFVFEYVQLLSLAPNLIEDEVSVLVKKISIYPLAFYALNDDVAYPQIYGSYAIWAMMIFTLLIVQDKCRNIDIIFQFSFLLCIGFGFVLYIPVIAMVMDLFMCSEEAKGKVFFDIDCNAECWDDEHTTHAICLGFSLILVIPTGMYLRIKFQHMLADLNILQHPKFIVLKTGIIIFMIISTKVLFQHPYVSSAHLTIGMLFIIGVNLVLEPYNYNRIQLYQNTLWMIYVVFIVFSSIFDDNFYLIVCFATFTFVLVCLSIWIQNKYAKKFPKMLSFPKSHKIEGMVRFQFICGNQQVNRGQKIKTFIESIKHQLSKPSDEIFKGVNRHQDKNQITMITEQYENIEKVDTSKIDYN